MTCIAGWGNRRCGRWECASCGKLREGDQRGVLLSALSVAELPSWLLTVTAPGDDVLPRDESGRCEWDPLASWCADRGERWRSLRNSAVRSARRRSPVLATCWQPQPGRGAPHAHCVIEATDDGYAYALAMDRLSPRYGFGFVDLARDSGWREHKPEARAGYRAAWYLSRYLAAGVKPWTHKEWKQLMPHVHRVKVHPKLTRQTKDTLRNRALRRQLYMAHAVGGRFPTFTSERHMMIVSRQLRGRPLGDLSKFSDEPYRELRASQEREAFEAFMREVSRKRPTARDDNQLSLPLDNIARGMYTSGMKGGE